MDYNNLSEQHTRSINNYIKLNKEIENLREKTINQDRKIIEVESQKTQLNKEKENLLKRIETLQSDVEDITGNPRYLSLKKEKEELEEDIKIYERKIKEKENLIDHVKSDKRKIMKFADSIVREKSNESLINFLKTSKIPYILIDPRTQKIIDYNESLKKELEINGKIDLKGMPYATILNGKENKEALKFNLKRFLDIDDKEEFDIKYENEGKKIQLHVTKQRPVSMNVDLEILGRKLKEAKVITCVPLVVEKASTWQKYHPHSLEEVMEKAIKEDEEFQEIRRKEIKDIYHGLITKHEWTSRKIDNIEKTASTEKEAFYHLKSEYLRLEAESEKQKSKAVKERRKQMLENRKNREEKLEKISRAFSKKFKLKKHLIKKKYEDSKNWDEFIVKCRELYKDKKRLEEEKEKVEKIAVSFLRKYRIKKSAVNKKYEESENWEDFIVKCRELSKIKIEKR